MGEIIRINHTDNYAVINKGFLEDDRISFKAKGILAYLLSRPNGWEVRITDLVRRSTEGKCAVYSALKELEEHGYYTKKPVRSEDNSRIMHWESTVFESPAKKIQNANNEEDVSAEPDGSVEETTEECASASGSEEKSQELEELGDNFLHSDFQHVEKQNLRNRRHNKYINTTNNDNNNIYCASDDAPHAIETFFEAVWKLYPRKRGKGKISAKQKKHLFSLGLQKIEKALERYKIELKRETWKQPQNGDTFFTRGYIDYLDDNYVPLEAQTPTAAPSASPATAKNRFNDFPQRAYNYDELEKMLSTT